MGKMQLICFALPGVRPRRANHVTAIAQWTGAEPTTIPSLEEQDPAVRRATAGSLVSIRNNQLGAAHAESS